MNWGCLQYLVLVQHRLGKDPALQHLFKMFIFIHGEKTVLTRSAQMCTSHAKQELANTNTYVQAVILNKSKEFAQMFQRTQVSIAHECSTT